MNTEEYKIKLEAFEGPMALLLHLIDKNRIDIYRCKHYVKDKHQ